MIQRIKNFVIRKLIEKANKKHIILGNNVVLKDMQVIIRKPVPGKIFLTIGNDSLISGRFVFENGNGKIHIGERTFIGGGLFVSIENIEIGSDVMFSWGCTIIDNNAHSLIWEERKTDVVDWKRGVDEGSEGKYKNWEHVKKGATIIHDKAWIGFNCIILKGVTIGEGAVIGAGSVVTRDIPAYSVAVGNPARIIRTMQNK